MKQYETRRQRAEQRIKGIPGVQGVSLNLVCCSEDRKSILYVGIEETGRACSGFHPAPQGNARLTEDVVRAGSEYEAALAKAILKGASEEDDSQGHALSRDPAVRAIQFRFVALAEAHLINLKDVLHNASNEDQRALAAEVLGYVKDKQAVVPDLVAALHDPSSGVRNNATRALMVFASFAPKSPARKIQISAEPFIEMLNSCSWTDRNKSSAALAELTVQRDPAVLSEIQKQALGSLLEMARWKWMGHAWSSLMILGRIGGLSDEEIEKDLEAGDREMVIAAASKAVL
jgi:hypothetical protein